MINTARHGKRLAATIVGVVFFFLFRDKSTVLPVTASHAHLAGPWEPAAGIQGGGNKWLFNHYHLWNHSDTAGNGQTDKPCNIVESGT